MMFAKLKSKLRAAAIRTVDALWNALAKIGDAITLPACANYIRHFGYFQST
jgi:hypothetical protein